MFTDVDDPITFAQKARAFQTRTDHARLRGTRVLRYDNGVQVKETSFLDPVSREYLVVVDTGEEAEAIKTYIINDGSLPKLLRYFGKQYEKEGHEH